jgi:hypothetical protein
MESAGGELGCFLSKWTAAATLSGWFFVALFHREEVA